MTRSFKFAGTGHSKVWYAGCMWPHRENAVWIYLDPYATLIACAIAVLTVISQLIQSLHRSVTIFKLWGWRSTILGFSQAYRMGPGYKWKFVIPFQLKRQVTQGQCWVSTFVIEGVIRGRKKWWGMFRMFKDVTRVNTNQNGKRKWWKHLQ